MTLKKDQNEFNFDAQAQEAIDAYKAARKNEAREKEAAAPPPPEVGVFVDGPLTYASMGGLRSRVILRESG